MIISLIIGITKLIQKTPYRVIVHPPSILRVYPDGCPEEPAWVAGVLTSLAQKDVPVITPTMQNSMVAERRERIAGFDLTMEPVIDPERQMPGNLKEECRVAFMRIPEAALPQGVCRGGSNFTINDLSGAKIEVQLLSKKFYIKRLSGGLAVPEGMAPGFSWAVNGSINAAWEAACEAVGGWAEPEPNMNAQ